MSSTQNEITPSTIHPATTESTDNTGSTEQRFAEMSIATEKGEAMTAASMPSALDATSDARGLIRIIQCTRCSQPLQDPMTLPCGNSLCRRCLPESHARQHISYPAIASRLQGFACPFQDCGQDHAVGDCSLDVTLTKVMDIVREDVKLFRPEMSPTPIMLEERDNWSVAGVPSLSEKQHSSQVLHGGRLVATYTMAELGGLKYGSELEYTDVEDAGLEYHYMDVAVLEHLKEATRSELDCQVCYALFLDPLTTSCGHTFCRRCLRRALDHSNCCPICRRELNVHPSVTVAQYPSNKRLSALIAGLCPDALLARIETAKNEDLHHIGELSTPLFICTSAFPHMPTFLHIFEPRYRLMIRRAIESGNRKFGMLLHNAHQRPQGELGAVRFYQYGTLLHIINMQLLPDGRSLIETVGVSRFKVLKHGVLDAYQVGQIERVDDISLADEEALEASETTVPPPATRAMSATDHFGSLPPHHAAAQARDRPFNMSEIGLLPTQILMEICASFVKRMQEQSAPWLHSRVLQAYGECPTDPALFPWWFASILPISEMEKYKLISTTSVRARLKICAGWVVRIEGPRS